MAGRGAGPYALNLTIDPAPGAGEASEIYATLTRKRTGEPVTGLQILHERTLHNFIVNLDFSSFVHIHHEDFSAITQADRDRATFHFPYAFPRPGNYRMVSEFTHRDRSWTTHFDIEVGAGVRPRSLDLSPWNEVNGISAKLATSPAVPVAGFETELVIALSRDGVDVTDLELILGSEVHMALWRSDGRHFGHAHTYTPHMAAMMADLDDASPVLRASKMADMMVAMMNMPSELVFTGPRLPLRYVFPEPGSYVLFLQCAPRGVATVFKFIVDVARFEEGMDTAIVSILDDKAAR
ncbi:MAG: hypothetical protein AAF384_19900 [Pseudomonadota bacterium]